MRRQRARSSINSQAGRRANGPRQYGNNNLTAARQDDSNLQDMSASYVNGQHDSMAAIRQIGPSNRRGMMNIVTVDSITNPNAVVGNYRTVQVNSNGRRPPFASGNSQRGVGPRLPPNLECLPKIDYFPIKKERWNTNEEILSLLLNFSKHEEWQTHEVVIRPMSTSMLMYSRKKVRYRRDGYCWKKRKDGKTTREDHMKLKVQGVECIYGCYVHSSVLPTFHRRCYWLLENPEIVIVHYLNVPYPDDDKLTGSLPNVALCVQSKEWTKEELLQQLQPIYEYLPPLPPEDYQHSLAIPDQATRRSAIVKAHIESAINEVLEEQKFLKTASTACLTDGLSCADCCHSRCVQVNGCAYQTERKTTSKVMPSKKGRKTTKRGAASCSGTADDYLTPPKIAYTTVENKPSVVNLISDTMAVTGTVNETATQPIHRSVIVDATVESQLRNQHQQQSHRNTLQVLPNDDISMIDTRMDVDVNNMYGGGVSGSGNGTTVHPAVHTSVIRKQSKIDSYVLPEQMQGQLSLNDLNYQQGTMQLSPSDEPYVQRENFQYSVFENGVMSVDGGLETAERDSQLQQQRETTFENFQEGEDNLDDVVFDETTIWMDDMTQHPSANTVYSTPLIEQRKELIGSQDGDSNDQSNQIDNDDNVSSDDIVIDDGCMAASCGILNSTAGDNGGQMQQQQREEIFAATADQEEGYENFEGIFSIQDMQSGVTAEELLESINIQDVTDDDAPSGDDNNYDGQQSLAAVLYENALENFDPATFNVREAITDNLTEDDENFNAVGRNEDQETSYTRNNHGGLGDSNISSYGSNSNSSISVNSNIVHEIYVTAGQSLRRDNATSIMECPLMVLEMDANEWSYTK